MVEGQCWGLCEVHTRLHSCRAVPSKKELNNEGICMWINLYWTLTNPVQELISPRLWNHFLKNTLHTCSKKLKQQCICFVVEYLFVSNHQISILPYFHVHPIISVQCEPIPTKITVCICMHIHSWRIFNHLHHSFVPYVMLIHSWGIKNPYHSVEPIFSRGFIQPSAFPCGRDFLYKNCLSGRIYICHAMIYWGDWALSHFCHILSQVELTFLGLGIWL